VSRVVCGAASFVCICAVCTDSRQSLVKQFRPLRLLLIVPATAVQCALTASSTFGSSCWC